jgi:hypothetical protein
MLASGNLSDNYIIKIWHYHNNFKRKSYKNKDQSEPAVKSGDANIHKIRPHHINYKDKIYKNNANGSWGQFGVTLFH